MLAHATTHLKCEILQVSYFHRPTARLFTSRTLSSSPVPASVRIIHLNRPSYRFRTMSSQVVEHLQRNVVVKEDLPLTSSYESAMEALSSLITSKKRGDGSTVGGKHGKLERMTIYLKILSLEKDIEGLKIIHVAGTKGKENMTEELPMPPFFQFIILLAFKVFICEQVDVAIVEVGLGGKRDSTNVIKEPIVCGITSLGMDHVETLGNTLGQIASHKAGILKPHVPAFVAPQLSEAMDVIQEVALGLMVPLEVATPLDSTKMVGKLRLSGDHQFINAGLAISLSKCWLQRTGNWEKLFGTQDILADKLPGAFYRGLSTAYLSGRAEIVYDTSSKSFNSSKVSEGSTGALVFYLDGAHSPESMEVCGRWFSTAVKENETSTCSIIKDKEQVWSNDYLEHTEEVATITKQILLFNCMEVRDPQVLLSRLLSTCASSGTHFSKALFVPSMSTHSRVTSAASAITADSLRRDLAWQFDLQRLWEKLIHGKEVDYVIDKESMMDAAAVLPHEFLYEDASNCGPVGNHFACSAVIPSLPLAITWLRDCVKANPSVRIQVLVTGSLHLVGDVLKLLRK
ncbi:folylpolyglutamate synthase isoform X3 [Argentina anserina]|uniref:folylpolyglutamate synthase isoform X3 n=1 Tax=Argentina anserina TaxID=57926 RepID=UPI002176390B|nr:folylpolyglutamate synthase isoform X3 [Potentilla anserina]